MGVIFFVDTDNKRLRLVTPCLGNGYMSGSPVHVSSGNPDAYNIHITYKFLGLVQRFGLMNPMPHRRHTWEGSLSSGPMLS